MSFAPINELLIRYFQSSYDYWLKEKDPFSCFEDKPEIIAAYEKFTEILNPISHKGLKAHQDKLNNIIKNYGRSSHELAKSLIELTGYNEIVLAYKRLPRTLLESGLDNDEGNQIKMLFLFHIMSISGLSTIHEDTLRDINRTVTWLIEYKDAKYIKKLIKHTFGILKKGLQRFPDTALHCVLNMGKGIYSTDDSDLVVFFINSVVEMGFQPPDFKGVSNDWQIQANAVHIQNIRTWLELSECNPKWSKKLLSSLTIYLSLNGVFIKDTDLFPRDITKFLNSDIAPVYNLAKQLARIFPAYFNEIGAEGGLREISTEMDEISNRKDILIHFLRKQSHVESSNQTFLLTEAVFEFWRTMDKKPLEAFIPPNIYNQLEADSPYVKGMHEIIMQLFQKKGIHFIQDLLTIHENYFNSILNKISNVSEQDKKRIKLTIEFYKLLYQKYHLDFLDIEAYLDWLHAHFKSDAFPDINILRKVLKISDTAERLNGLLNYLKNLKEVILSKECYEIREDIYRKRHFTIDIPSMYGSYHEMKFNALGFSFRLESLVNVFFENLVQHINLKLITRATFFQILNYLRLFEKALSVDGLLSGEMAEQIELLSNALDKRAFTFTQYLDIFKGIANALKNIVHDYIHNIHEKNLSEIFQSSPRQHILPKYLPPHNNITPEALMHRLSEIFFRERIAASLGLRQFDVFLSRILNTLFRQAEKLQPKLLHSLLNYDPGKAMTPIINANKDVMDVIHLGRKGYNLVKLKSFGFPIPPGFVITTEIFRSRGVIEEYEPARRDFEDQVAVQIKRLEDITGKKFGKPDNPLLLSVRSGSSISQPGMMNTFLNVGINEKIAEGIGKNSENAWFAWDNYRRFLQIYGMSFGVKRDDFDTLMADFKNQTGAQFKRNFSGKEMKSLALIYKDWILKKRIYIPEEPFEQLHVAIKRILDSWHSEKAKVYRNIIGISDDWGTAVTVQTMVFGNLHPRAGSGVSFSHPPRDPGDILRLWGDFTSGNQGEDIVAGLVKTYPITTLQADIEKRPGESLESEFPEIYQALKDFASELVDKRGWGPQEMEFTFEGPSKKDLHILQTRGMSLRMGKRISSFEMSYDMGGKFIGHGIGVSGGAMAGRVIFNLDEIREWRKKEPDTSLILARNDTVPDDIQEIYEADGLLTARGGSTSHASVVAHRLGKTCVVGCADLVCMEDKKICVLNGYYLKSGDHISIDGSEGSIYWGLMKIREIKV